MRPHSKSRRNYRNFARIGKRIGSSGEVSGIHHGIILQERTEEQYEDDFTPDSVAMDVSDIFEALACDSYRWIELACRKLYVFYDKPTHEHETHFRKVEIEVERIHNPPSHTRKSAVIFRRHTRQLSKYEATIDHSSLSVAGAWEPKIDHANLPIA